MSAKIMTQSHAITVADYGDRLLVWGRALVKEKIRIEGVSKIFGDDPHGAALAMLQAGASKDEIKRVTDHVVGVDRADFVVNEGEIFVVMGLSGSGKSTLIRCVNRLVEPTSGRVTVDDIDVTALDEAGLQRFRRDHTGMVFQHFALFPHQDVRSNVAFGLKVKGMGQSERNAAAEKALALVGLEGYEKSLPSQLSGGMQQRVGLARALATEPDILLMDEAFSALDPLIRRQMQDELIDIQAAMSERNTILFITHDLNEALRVGSRVCIMKDGAIHQIGTPEDILMRPETDYVAEFVQDVDQGRVLLVESVMEQASIVAADATVADALSVMSQNGHDAAHLVDGDGRPLGVFSAADAEALRTAGSSTAGSSSLATICRASETTTSEMMLAKLYQRCGDGLPIAVLDGDGRIVGAVRPLEVLAELGRVESVSERLEQDKKERAAEPVAAGEKR